MPFFKTLLVELAPVFDSLDNKIIITGHTDAMAYKTISTTTGTFRAIARFQARRVLEEAGMPEDKVMQVSAMADQMLLDAKIRKARATGALSYGADQSASDTLYQYLVSMGIKWCSRWCKSWISSKVLSQRTR